ncbi:MAG: hypothetical protein C0469_17470 [Cyanobacteria bacterium DS2.3.42]|nr:hypothetical protein [Cyanobacteria bacterium DS2.3.42]
MFSERNPVFVMRVLCTPPVSPSCLMLQASPAPRGAAAGDEAGGLAAGDGAEDLGEDVAAGGTAHTGITARLNAHKNIWQSATTNDGSFSRLIPGRFVLVMETSQKKTNSTMSRIGLAFRLPRRSQI